MEFALSSKLFSAIEMESLGKPASSRSDFKNTGQIIFGGYGTTAQHSYFQLLDQVTQDICADIISTTDDKKSLSMAQAMTQSKLLAYGEHKNRLNKELKINGNLPVNLFLLKKFNSVFWCDFANPLSFLLSIVPIATR